MYLNHPARMIALRRFAAILMLGIGLMLSTAARADVVVTFWSQEMGRDFPHAFFTLHGTRHDNGRPVRASYGFTPKAITPAILMGRVPGRIDLTTDRYIARSNAHFSLVITDAQYDAILSQVEQWGENGDHHYLLNKRNCVHFVAEAMRRAGLTVVEERKLMKKPRSFIQSIERLNEGRVTVLEMPAAQYVDWPKPDVLPPAPPRECDRAGATTPCPVG